MQKSFLVIAAAVATLGAALPAAAQFRNNEAAIEYREGAFTVMAYHFGRIGAMVQGRVPFDAAAAQSDAELVATMSKLPFTAFVDGTAGTKKGTPKPTVWTERAKFDEGAKKMQDEVVKLVAATMTGSLDQVKTAFAATNTSCKGCHDNYRNP